MVSVDHGAQGLLSRIVCRLTISLCTCAIACVPYDHAIADSMPVFRHDRVPLKATKTDAGFLRGEANITRIGVFTYRNEDGTSRRELRLPEEVFKADSMASFGMAPMTRLHPDRDVTAENAKELQIGMLGEAVKQDGKFLRAPYVITDGATIRDVESGRMQELSCGYSCDLEMTSGTHDGEPYDAIQRNIKGNHVAVVPIGRAGPEVRIDENADNKRNVKMEKIVIDGVEVEVSPIAAQVIKRAQLSLTQQVDKLTKDAADAKVAAEKAQGKADGLEAEVKKLKEDASPEKITQRINDRVALVSSASKVLDEKGDDGKVVPFKADALSDDDIKRAVIAKVQPTADLKGKSADYVNARFDAAMEGFKADESNQDAVTQANGAARAAIVHADAATGVKKADDARKKMIERNQNAWKPAEQKRA